MYTIPKKSSGLNWLRLFSINKSQPHVSWDKIVWNKNLVPIFSFFLWLSARLRLMTRDRLLRMGLCKNDMCILCCAAQESVNHLFFECNFSAPVWVEVMRRCGYKRKAGKWEDELERITHCSGKKNFSKNL